MKQPSGANDRLRLGIVEHCPARTRENDLREAIFGSNATLKGQKEGVQRQWPRSEWSGGPLLGGLAESQSALVDGENKGKDVLWRQGYARMAQDKSG